MLSVSSVVGFTQLGEILRIREVKGLMQDVIKQEELKVLRGDFEKVVIHYYEDYLVVEEYLENADLDLDIASCVLPFDVNNYQLVFDSDQDSNLTKLDHEGEILEIKSVSAGSTECINFNDPNQNPSDIEWAFQLTSGSDESNVIRFIHFNLKRDLQKFMSIDPADAGAKVEISAPYGKKRVFDSSGTLFDDSDSPLVIQVIDESGNSEALTLL